MQEHTPQQPASQLNHTQAKKKGGLFAKLPLNMRGLLGLVGLVSFAVIAMLGVLIAQRQSQSPTTPVAPNAPESIPQAAGQGTCSVSFTVSEPPTATPTPPLECGSLCPNRTATNGGCPSGLICKQYGNWYCSLPTSGSDDPCRPPQATATIVPPTGTPTPTRTPTPTPTRTPTPTPPPHAACVKVAEGATALTEGSEFTYSVTVSPSSPTSGTYSFSDTLPAQLEFVSFVTNNTQGWTHNNQIITGQIDGLSSASGAKTFKYRVRVKQGAAPSNSIVNSATLTGIGNTVSNTCQVAVTLPPYGTAQCVKKEAFRAPFTGQNISQTVVELGEELEYRISVTADRTTLGPVVMVDTLPSAVTYVANSLKVNGVAATPTINGSQLSVNLGTMANNNQKETKLIAFRVRVKDNASVGTFSNTANITTGGAHQSNCATHTLEIPPRGVAWCEAKDAYLSLANETPISYFSGVLPGQEFYYKIQVKSDNETRGQVTVVDDLPDELEFVGGADYSPSTLTYNPSTHQVRATFNSFADDEERFVTFKVRVKANAKPTQPDEPLDLKNVVSVTTEGVPGQPPSARYCENLLSIPAQGTAVCVGKTAHSSYSADPASQTLSGNHAVNPGDEFFYRVAFKTQDATKGTVIVVDTLPNTLEMSPDISRNTEGIQVNGNQVTYYAGSLSSGQEGFVEFKVRVKENATVGTFSNNAVVTTGNDPNTAQQCSTSLVIPPRGAGQCQMKEAYTTFTASGGTKIPENTKVNPFQEFVYKLVISAADQTAGAITVTDYLPAVLEFVQDSQQLPTNIATQSLADGRTRLTISLPQMAGNTTQTIEFKVKVKDTGTLGTFTNKAEVATGGLTQETVPQCQVSHHIPAPVCGETCTTDRQCQQANNDYVCDGATNTCRLDSNRESATCQPKPQTYACNSPCSDNSQCESVNSNYFCSVEYGNVCRLKDNPGTNNCLPKEPQPTPTPQIGCNDICTSNADCTNPDHICFTTSDGTNRCRLDNYPNSTTCTTPTTTYTPVVSAPQPAPPPALPQAGPEDWMNWLKVGIVILGVGGLLLLLL